MDEGDEDELTESDVELEGNIVEPDDESLQKMGDPSVEVVEESRDVSQQPKPARKLLWSEGTGMYTSNVRGVSDMHDSSGGEVFPRPTKICRSCEIV